MITEPWASPVLSYTLDCWTLALHKPGATRPTPHDVSQCRGAQYFHTALGWRWYPLWGVPVRGANPVVVVVVVVVQMIQETA